MTTSPLPIKMIADPVAHAEKEHIYITVRYQERRMYYPEEIRLLPEVKKNGFHYEEWQVRKQSLQRLLSYLEKKFPSPISILDLGCGNGWMSDKLAQGGKNSVSAVDLNLYEMKRGAEAFAGNTSLQFIYADIFDPAFPQKDFDVIVLAASTQYFPSFEKLVHRLFELLKPDGEIHVLDSYFYPIHELDDAKKRTAQYYDEKGLPEMTAFYFHHSEVDLISHFPTLMYSPPSSLFLRIINKLFLKKKIPAFKWWMIRKNQ